MTARTVYGTMATAVEDPRPTPSRPLLLYDGECFLCSAFARLVAWADRGHALRVLPYQASEGRTWLPDWSEERVESAAHLVLPDGRVVSGSEALGGVLDRLPVVGPVHRRGAGAELLRRLDDWAYRLGVALRDRTACAVPARPSPDPRQP